MRRSSPLKTVSKLKSHLQKFRSYKVYQQSLLSPTRKLPNELLAHIFSFVSDEYVNLAGDPSYDFWGIQLVCVRWRSIVHNTPSLWTKFSIVDPQLTNSGTAPLAISLLPGPYMQFQFSLVEDIANHCDRWESFEVDMEILLMAARDTDITDTVKNRGLPILRRVAIDNQSFPKAEIISPFTLFRIFLGATCASS
ncbi:hypothetical protein BDQ17DRAFT_758587 [Cyathus striatus]|nr:hypothetical protein BDQ17DRAFT_758587 [Cyathus striatus]